MNPQFAIESFKGEFYFLSNFYSTPVEFEGVIYPSSENAYQAAKTTDLTERAIFADGSITASKAKRLGKRVAMREDWNDVRIDIMRKILKSKFSNQTMRNLLINTGSTQLIEGNWWNDTFWGVCNGKGENWLGKLLMEVRASLSKPGPRKSKTGEVSR